VQREALEERVVRYHPAVDDLAGVVGIRQPESFDAVTDSVDDGVDGVSGIVLVVLVRLDGWTAPAEAKVWAGALLEGEVACQRTLDDGEDVEDVGAELWKEPFGPGLVEPVQVTARFDAYPGAFPPSFGFKSGGS
jgi:hypothetical protein